MVVLVTCKNKNERVNSDIIMLPYSQFFLPILNTKRCKIAFNQPTSSVVYYRIQIDGLFCMLKFLKKLWTTE